MDTAEVIMMQKKKIPLIEFNVRKYGQRYHLGPGKISDNPQRSHIHILPSNLNIRIKRPCTDKTDYFQ